LPTAISPIQSGFMIWRPLLFASWMLAASCSAESGQEPIVAMTFNTGTNIGMGHDEPPEDGYSTVEAEWTDTYYGNGLAWLPLMDDTREFFAAQKPDIVAFQEIFYSGECEEVPEEARRGFICEDWQAGDATVATLILGSDYQVACHLEKPDKCLAIRKDFGTLRGCSEDMCLDGLDGVEIDTCGNGSRLGRGVVDMIDGGTLTVVNVHGSSGISPDDQGCRVKQFEHVFADFGDGQPAANGEVNLVLGDFNTDPARMFDGDESARRLFDFAGEERPFHFLSEVGLDATPSYAGFFNIDHVLSDVLEGDCWVPGATQKHAPVSDIVFFDHKPIVCNLDRGPLAK
jgi:hypothetical protein